MTVKQFQGVNQQQQQAVTHDSSRNSEFPSSSQGTLHEYSTKDFKIWMKFLGESGKVSTFIQLCKDDLAYELESLEDLNRTMKRPLAAFLNRQ